MAFVELEFKLSSWWTTTMKVEKMRYFSLCMMYLVICTLLMIGCVSKGVILLVSDHKPGQPIMTEVRPIADVILCSSGHVSSALLLNCMQRLRKLVNNAWACMFTSIHVLKTWHLQANNPVVTITQVMLANIRYSLFVYTDSLLALARLVAYSWVG